MNARVQLSQRLILSIWKGGNYLDSLKVIYQKLFSLSYEIGRIEFLIKHIVIIFIFNRILNYLEYLNSINQFNMSLTFLILLLIIAWISIVNVKQRLNDLNLRWLCLILYAIPYINFLLILFLILKGGKANMKSVQEKETQNIDYVNRYS